MRYKLQITILVYYSFVRLFGLNSTLQSSKRKVLKMFNLNNFIALSHVYHQQSFNNTSTTNNASIYHQQCFKKFLNASISIFH